MIRAEFLTGNAGVLTGFRISGHSGSGHAGDDIVCAAVSSAAYLAANTITEVIRADARVDCADGFLFVQIPEKMVRACRDLLEGLKLHLLGLEEQYPKNIIVSYVEVSDYAED